ncbi:hypothetical protein RUM44_012347 [Polyplax serrata]|uniref:Uncharacterized protein n=1 Tax=Polyplax serrata TaxID=468196 RepID=A0ABR1BB13_POLSC
MGSLPNLRSLSNDPNTVYNYELCDPENDATSTEGKSRKRLLTCLPRTGGNFESLSEVHNIRNVNLNFAGDAAAPGRIQFHHRRIRHTRSSGSQYNYQMQNANLNWDDYLLQPQLSAYSPISSRSSRSNVTWSANNALYNFGPGSNSRNHRDSLTSSGGASSVRRLIAVVRSTPSRLGPVYSRKVLCRNFAALCLGHVTVTAALLPLISLQSSVSTWWWPNDSITQSSDVGSFLLCGSFAVASIFTLLSPTIIHLLGCNWTLVCGYVCTSAFFVAHLYPTIRCLILAYVLLGVCLGPVTCARVSYIVTLANKLTYVMTEEEEMYEQINGEAKESILQKLSRGLQASQDLGMVLGNIVAWCFLYYSRNIEQERTVLKTLFNEDESGDWVCGSQSSPYFERTIATSEILGNSTWYEEIVVSCRATAMLASVFVGCGVVAVALTAAFTDKIRLFLYQDPLERPHGVEVYHAVKNAFKDPILQLAAPMSVFIGLHQGFIHADFSKWYVACSLGIPNISLVFLSMGLLQSVAAFTLSLLLQNVPRYLVIATGFIFHSCLLLVLLLWKPSGDDAALFYVIAAAWGVCSIIWETLNFNLLLHIYPDSTWQVAFVHGNFFKFLGLSVALGLHGVLSTRVKLYALAFFMIVGIAPHTWLEMKLAAKRKMKSALSTL